jgi:hypothetical protein
MSPQPTDRSWRDVLRLMEVPGAPGLFVLGCFARRVTVYSQQLRALNLVDTLCGMGYLRRSKRVAVAGAGFGGITAAAALAQVGVRVSLYDAEPVPMHLQLSSAKRFLHPHIYEWPCKKIDDVDANLPVLNWQADYANNVAKHIRESWKSIREKAQAALVQERFSERITSIQRQGQQWSVGTASGRAEPYDLVILAVGFGVEKADVYSYPYWADIWLDDPHGHKRKWLISGAGDGALTDVMRLCIRNCEHGETLARTVRAIIEHTAEPFLDLFIDRVRKGVVGTELFDGLDAEGIARSIGGDSMQYLREDEVLLNASEEKIFGRPAEAAAGTPEIAPRASVLNRLITWVMIQVGRVKLVDGTIDRDPKKRGLTGERGDLTVKLCRKGPDLKIKCEEVLLRHGPVPALGGEGQDARWLEAGVKRGLGRLQRAWQDLYEGNAEDPTLATDWSGDAFEPDRLGADFVSVPGMLLYSREQLEREVQVLSLVNAVDAVIKEASVRTQLTEATGRQYDASARVAPMSIEAALRDPRSLGRALQALCDAPVLIVDGTCRSPDLMFLLGVRSVVRRGVTLVFHVGEVTNADWQDMPFNMRELRVVSVRDRSSLRDFEKPLKTALEEGLRRYARRPFQYMDLPGFEALRSLGPNDDDHSPRAPGSEVLVLCPFDHDYEQACWPAVQRALRACYGPGRDGEGPARRVIDVESPEVVGRRLFESIRRDDECVVDLTMRKPNVYFELGLRVAAHEKGARLIRCADLLDSAPEEPIGVEKLFGVRNYWVNAPAKYGVREALQLDSATWPGGSVTARYAYDVIRRCIFVRQEAGGIGVLDLLWQSAERVTGKDRRRQASFPVLYFENTEVHAQTARFAFDALLGYVLLAARVETEARDNRRRIALSDLKYLVRDLDVEQQERATLEQLIASLEAET